jgi:branched-chain amino acid transport system permease protein
LDGKPIFLLDFRPYYWLILATIILAVFLIRNLARSRVGRAWIAIREDEDAAELMGVPTFRFKLWAFAVGAAVGGLSGGLWAGQANFVNSSTFSLENSILVLAAVLLGGAGNIGGAILGGFLVIYVPEWLRSVGEVFGLPETVNIGGTNYDVSPTSLRYFIFGILLVVVMIFRPQGLWPNRRRAAEFKDRQKEVAAVE